MSQQQPFVFPGADAATIGSINSIKRELHEDDDGVAVRSALRISEQILQEIAEGGILLVKKPNGGVRRLFVKPRGRR